MDEFDLIVIGAGPGGYVAALEAAKNGMKTAVVESGALGGTCLNRGCIPTKTLLHTAELAREVREGAEIGLCAPELSVDMEQLQRYKNSVVEKLSGGIGMLFQKQKVALYRGKGKLLSPNRVQVDGEDTAVLQTKNILIATGSAPVKLPVPGADLEGVFNSDGMLDQTRLYDRMVIIGGGVIGMEFASLYAALGCKVTVIEALDRMLANLDKEFGQNLGMILKKQGVEIHTGTALKEIRKADGLCCVCEKKGAALQVQADAVLIAVGRRPVTVDLFSAECAPAVEKGRILVDEHGRTSIPNVYAIGDVTGGIQLAHAASAQGINVVAEILGREPKMHMVVPSCVYTSPEIASVGLSAEEAKDKGINVTVKKYAMSGNGKTVLTRQGRSFLKVVLDEAGVIVGAQMMCGRATDMIGEFASAIVNRLTLDRLEGVIRPHPTYNEAVWELARE